MMKHKLDSVPDFTASIESPSKKLRQSEPTLTPLVPVDQVELDNVDSFHINDHLLSLLNSRQLWKRSVEPEVFVLPDVTKNGIDEGVYVHLTHDDGFCKCTCSLARSAASLCVHEKLFRDRIQYFGASLVTSEHMHPILELPVSGLDGRQFSVVPLDDEPAFVSVDAEGRTIQCENGACSRGGARVEIGRLVTGAGLDQSPCPHLRAMRLHRSAWLPGDEYAVESERPNTGVVLVVGDEAEITNDGFIDEVDVLGATLELGCGDALIPMDSTMDTINDQMNDIPPVLADLRPSAELIYRSEAELLTASVVSPDNTSLLDLERLCLDLCSRSDVVQYLYLFVKPTRESRVVRVVESRTLEGVTEGLDWPVELRGHVYHVYGRKDMEERRVHINGRRKGCSTKIRTWDYWKRAVRDMTKFVQGLSNGRTSILLHCKRRHVRNSPDEEFSLHHNFDTSFMSFVKSEIHEAHQHPNYQDETDLFSMDRVLPTDITSGLRALCALSNNHRAQFIQAKTGKLSSTKADRGRNTWLSVQWDEHIRIAKRGHRHLPSSPRNRFIYFMVNSLKVDLDRHLRSIFQGERFHCPEFKVIKTSSYLEPSPPFREPSKKPKLRPLLPKTDHDQPIIYQMGEEDCVTEEVETTT